MIDLDETLRSLHSASFQWALHCTGGRRADAEDALQAAYVALFDGSAKFGGQSSFKTFLFGVIRNKARSVRRSQKPGRLVRLEVADEPAVDEVGARELERAEQRRAIRHALLDLSPKQREVLELVFYHDLTIEEAAQVMDIQLGTARTHYKRGKNALRDNLDDGEFQWPTATTNS